MSLHVDDDVDRAVNALFRRLDHKETELVEARKVNSAMGMLCLISVILGDIICLFASFQ